MHAADLLSKRANLTPDREAVYDVGLGRRFSYAELNKRANRAANFLQTACGVVKGDRVSILAENSVVYIDLLFGLGKIGAIFAPLNWRLTSRELIYIVNDCSPKVLIYESKFTQKLDEMLPSIQIGHLVKLDQDTIAEGKTYNEQINLCSDLEPLRPPLDDEDPFCILYTSGTTGRPKGAVLPHRQVVWNAINTVISWGLSERDVSPILTPMFHSGGLFVFLVPLIYVGGRIILAHNFDPDESLRLISNESCSVILGVPTLFQVWMNSPSFPHADFSKVHFFISGGAPCPPALIKAWHQAKHITLRQGYGLTEVGVNCFSMTDEEALTKAGSVGKPIFHSAVRLVNFQGQDVPLGETGELIISGPHVCSGYWKNLPASAQALIDGWFHTGDMAHQDSEGYFYISGRYKDMIISGGENIYAAEVEAVFREHPAVADAALIGLPDPKWGEVGLIVVALKPDYIDPPGRADLLEFCRTRLAKYKIPKHVEFISSLPYSPYGKVIKDELRLRYLARPAI